MWSPRLRYQSAPGHWQSCGCDAHHGARESINRMKYQHPELEQVRRVLNGTNSNFNPEQGLNGTFYGTVTKQ